MAMAILVAFSFVVLVDSFCCPEEYGQEASAPVECCLQCCPRHHLAPTSSHLSQQLPESVFENFCNPEFSTYSSLFADPIFHPPKSSFL